LFIGVQPPGSYLPEDYIGTSGGMWQILGSALETSWYTAKGAFADIFSRENWSSVWFYVFLYLVFAIGSSVTLSGADLQGARRGFIYLVIFVLIFNAATLWLGDFMYGVSLFFARITGFMNAYILVAALLNLCFLLVVGGLASLRRK
jgi:hypothetical protein